MHRKFLIQRLFLFSPQTYNPSSSKLRNFNNTSAERVRRAGRSRALGEQPGAHATAEAEPRRQHHELPQIGADRCGIPPEVGARARPSPRGIDLQRELVSKKHRRSSDERRCGR